MTVHFKIYKKHPSNGRITSFQEGDFLDQSCGMVVFFMPPLKSYFKLYWKMVSRSTFLLISHKPKSLKCLLSFILGGGGEGKIYISVPLFYYVSYVLIGLPKKKTAIVERCENVAKQLAGGREGRRKRLLNSCKRPVIEVIHFNLSSSRVISE